MGSRRAAALKGLERAGPLPIILRLAQGGGESETRVQAIKRPPVETYFEAFGQPGPFTRVEARLETVCQRGCRQVRLDIAALEGGAEIPETLGLAPEERRLLLAELRAVMAVYGDACRIG
jgi:hypothetical protein